MKEGKVGLRLAAQTLQAWQAPCPLPASKQTTGTARTRTSCGLVRYARVSWSDSRPLVARASLTLATWTCGERGEEARR